MLFYLHTNPLNTFRLCELLHRLLQDVRKIAQRQLLKRRLLLISYRYLLRLRVLGIQFNLSPMVYQSLLGKSLILIHSYRDSLRSLLHVRAHIGLHLVLTLCFPFTLITSVFWLLYVIHQQIHSILDLRR